MKKIILTSVLALIYFSATAQKPEYIRYPIMSKYKLKEKTKKAPAAILIGKANFYAKDYKQAEQFLKNAYYNKQAKDMLYASVYKLNKTHVRLSRGWHIGGLRHLDTYEGASAGAGDYRHSGGLWLNGEQWNLGFRHGFLPVKRNHDQIPLFEVDVRLNMTTNRFTEEKLSFKEDGTWSETENGVNERLRNEIDMTSYSYGIWIYRLARLYRSHQDYNYTFKYEDTESSIIDINAEMDTWGIALGNYKTKNDVYVELDWQFALSTTEIPAGLEVDKQLLDFSRLTFTTTIPVFRYLEVRAGVDWSFFNNNEFPVYWASSNGRPSLPNWKRVETLGFWLGAGLRF